MDTLHASLITHDCNIEVEYLERVLLLTQMVQTWVNTTNNYYDNRLFCRLFFVFDKAIDRFVYKMSENTGKYPLEFSNYFF